MTRILIVDDDMFFRKVITKLLSGHGYDIVAAEGGAEALETLKTNTFDLMISDINMTPMDGMELLEKSREAYPDMGVIMLTGHDEIEVAVSAMKKGAFDFLVKPFQIDELFSTVQRSLTYYNASPESTLLEERVTLLEGLVTGSAAMQKLCEMIRRIAPANVAVLLSGEEGIDYKLIARTLHYYSLRKDAAFVVFDCEAQSADSISRKLFQRSKGQPGLFEAAKDGTLFIDNIHAMPLDAQLELLTWIQFKRGDRVEKPGDMEIDVRVVAASSKKLDQFVEQSVFSDNLYHRLSALQIEVPALHSRPEDIPFLIDQAIHENIEAGKSIPAMGKDARRLLCSYTWPGNHKELVGTIRHLLFLAKDGAITKDLLPPEIIAAAPSGKPVTERERLRGQSFSALWQEKQKKIFSKSGESSEA
ncbi:MAG: sigma-54-dependent Fis family transcriptional regulator [Kiritimatiellales bacterium]|nr:sigma-54-dependent Fis family transcriptional regulator [Kiritimatiellota bacterium]MBL7011397.1 sigma-54-dependent Fis family transcriptional regulator [Kiritimatiellales bacterium]